MGIIKSFVTFVMGDRRHTAFLEDSEFTETAALEIDGDGSLLTLDFAQTIQDGNDIVALNYIVDGQVVASQELYAGDERTEMGFSNIDIDIETIKLAYVDSNNNIVYRAVVESGSNPEVGSVSFVSS